MSEKDVRVCVSREVRRQFPNMLDKKNINDFMENLISDFTENPKITEDNITAATLDAIIGFKKTA